MLGRLLAVACGGAIGSVFRYLLSSWVEGFFENRNFPAGIFVCNVLGSLVIGILLGLMFDKAEPNALWRLFLVVGLCGGFTTFSSFSMDNITLLRSGATGLALANIFFSVGLCLLATYIGLIAVKNA